VAKPSVEAWRSLLKELGCFSTQQAVAVSCKDHEIASAMSLGMKGIWVQRASNLIGEGQIDKGPSGMGNSSVAAMAYSDAYAPPSAACTDFNTLKSALEGRGDPMRQSGGGSDGCFACLGGLVSMIC
jgi:hypothetical protein